MGRMAFEQTFDSARDREQFSAFTKGSKMSRDFLALYERSPLLTGLIFRNPNCCTSASEFRLFVLNFRLFPFILYKTVPNFGSGVYNQLDIHNASRVNYTSDSVFLVHM